MKRDNELILDILKAIEEYPKATIISNDNALKFPASNGGEISDEKVSHHIDLLVEAGYLKSGKIHTAEGNVSEIKMTWDGYEYLGKLDREGFKII